MEFDIEKAKKNIKLDPLHVNHKDLKRVDGSEFKSECPECKTGVLLMGRDFTTFNLQKHDNCMFCGRRFIYDDINGNSQTLNY